MLVRYFTAPVLALMLLSGCATIVEGTRQKVALKAEGPNGELEGVHCTITDSQGPRNVVTPGWIDIRRSRQPLQVQCELPGYRMAQEAQVRSKGGLLTSAAKGAGAGAGTTAIAALPLLAAPVIGWIVYPALVLTGAAYGTVVGAGTDAISGAHNQYPDKITVKMEPAHAS